VGLQADKSYVNFVLTIFRLAESIKYCELLFSMEVMLCRVETELDLLVWDLELEEA
jgi:hypothetical protein